jgi:hypothetical protein
MKPPGHPAEERGLLFQKDIDPSKKDRGPVALIGFVGFEREVQGEKGHGMTLPAQGSHECIVAEAIPAVHPPGAWCELDDPHELARKRLATD